MKTFTASTRPRCVAFVHRFMGDISLCGKFADWLVHNVPHHKNYKYDGMPVCRDCIAKALINTGDGIDNVTFDGILITK